MNSFEIFGALFRKDYLPVRATYSRKRSTLLAIIWVVYTRANRLNLSRTWKRCTKWHPVSVHFCLHLIANPWSVSLPCQAWARCKREGEWGRDCSVFIRLSGLNGNKTIRVSTFYWRLRELNKCIWSRKRALLCPFTRKATVEWKITGFTGNAICVVVNFILENWIVSKHSLIRLEGENVSLSNT